MAFTAQTAFEARITNNEFDNLCNIAGLYVDSNDDAADCDAGRLVKRSALAPCEGFTGVYNENTWTMVDAVSTDTIDEVIYACNTYDTKLLGANGKNYFVGLETLGLGVPAGRYGNFTKINFDGQSVYRIGAGNLNASLGANEFLTIDDGEYAPAASAPATAGSIYFKVIGTGSFIEGTSASFTYYDVVACKVTA